jgi:hydrogenase maturation protease
MTLADVVERPLLIYGIGNVGRQDDGLGPLLVERLEEAAVPEGVTLESGYQLAPEDALALSQHAAVLFVDASAAGDAPAPYTLDAVSPSEESSFSTHVMSMESLLALCDRLYGRRPRAYALAIPGYGFEVNGILTPAAEANLGRAVLELKAALALRGCCGKTTARLG